MADYNDAGRNGNLDLRIDHRVVGADGRPVDHALRLTVCGSPKWPDSLARVALTLQHPI